MFSIPNTWTRHERRMWPRGCQVASGDRIRETNAANDREDRSHVTLTARVWTPKLHRLPEPVAT
jgi:hypothetical protein